MFKTFQSSLLSFDNEHGLANSRARLRMTVLYQVASANKGIVVGTGNKIEDFGIGFYTKYGDGGVDISPIGDCNKTEVWELGKELKILDEIMKAQPTDGLWDDGRTDEGQLGLKYEELTETERNKFNCYEVRVEVIGKTRSMPEETFNSEIHRIFERLNSGRSLSGNDKYHLYRSSSPVIMLALELKDSPEFRDNFKKYIGKIGEGKSRSLLSDTVGCFLALTRTDTSRADCINTSYERNCRHIHDEISETSRQNVIEFFRFYFDLLDDALTSVASPKKCYGKLSSALGLLLYGWIQNKEHVQTTEYDIWKSFITQGLARGYHDTLFSTLRPGDRRNLTSSSLKIRWEHVLNHYQLVQVQAHQQAPTQAPPQVRLVLIEDDSVESSDNEDDSSSDTE